MANMVIRTNYKFYSKVIYNNGEIMNDLHNTANEIMPWQMMRTLE